MIRTSFLEFSLFGWAILMAAILSAAPSGAELTPKLLEITSGSGDSEILQFAATDDRFFILVNPTIGDGDLWVGDGIDLHLVDATAGPDFNVERIYAHENLLYMYAGDPIYGRELWRLEGEVPVFIANLREAEVGSAIYAFCSLNGDLFFGAWFVGEIFNPYPAIFRIREGQLSEFKANAKGLTPVGDYLFFTDNEDFWLSDGTYPGTRRYVDGPAKNQYGVVGGASHFFYTARTTQFGREMYVGSYAENTGELLADIRPGPGHGVEFITLDVIGDQAFFTADNGTNGDELWTSDGTPAGTYMLHEFRPGPGDGVASSVPGDYPFMVAKGNCVYFTAYQSGVGYGLWRLNANTFALDFLGSNTRPDAKVPKNITLLENSFCGYSYYHSGSGNYLLPHYLDLDTGDFVPMAELFPDASYSAYAPSLPESHLDMLFYTQDDVHGREAWLASRPLEADASVPGEFTVDIGERLKVRARYKGGLGKKSFQWYFTPYGRVETVQVGEDSPFLTIPSVSRANEGVYYATVTDMNHDTIESAPIDVSVIGTLPAPSSYLLFIILGVLAGVCIRRSKRYML